MSFQDEQLQRFLRVGPPQCASLDKFGQDTQPIEEMFVMEHFLTVPEGTSQIQVNSDALKKN